MKRVAHIVQGAALMGAAIGVSTSYASPFVRSYDGSSGVPEANGWQRLHYDPDEVYIRSSDSDGLLLDGSASRSTYENYYLANGDFAVAPDEALVVEWRVQVLTSERDDSLGGDVNVAVAAADRGFVNISLYPDRYEVWRSSAASLLCTGDLDAAVPHEYQLNLSTSGMFVFRVDGLSGCGGHTEAGNAAWPWFVGWGDAAAGLSSVSRWSNVTVAVVPEPATLVLLAIAVARIPSA